MDNLGNDIIYINRISSELQLFKQVRKNLWVCRCPLCGDSKQNKFKRRFYFYLDKGKYWVKCHNCGAALPFDIFLKDNFPNVYSEYLIDKFPHQNSLKKNRFKDTNQNKLKNIISKKVKCKGFNYTFLKRFDELSKNHPARIYVEKRKIPDWAVYYSDNFSNTLRELNLEKYMMSYEKATEPRMIIPFYREDGLSTVFQSRSFSKKEGLRYITIKEDDSESKIYGMERVNKNETVYCTEGPLDSIFIPNAIAMSGISTKIPKGIQDIVFVYDNEPRNNDVVKNMRKRLKAGYKVVIFPERMTYKDINDMIVYGGMDQKKILDIITDNVYSAYIGLMKLNEWNKN